MHLCHARGRDHALGAFVPLSQPFAEEITDPAQCAMLARFAAEVRLGNFGQYVGSHIAGDVRPLTKG